EKMFVAFEAELVLPPLPPPPLPVFVSRTAVPGTTVIVSAAIARDAPIEQRINARSTRRMKKADRDEDVVFIGFGSSVGTTTIAKSIIISRTTLSADVLRTRSRIIFS